MRAWSHWQDWTKLIAGAWLFASPGVVRRAGHPTAAGNARILGPAIRALALWALAEPAARALDWWLVAAAAWVFVAPWLLVFTAVVAAAWNAWVIGVAVVIVTILSIGSVGAGAQGEAAEVGVRHRHDTEHDRLACCGPR